MKLLKFLLPTVLFAGMFSFAFIAPTNTTTATLESADVLAWIKEVNGAGKPKPPATFKSGHVDPFSYADYLTKSDKGFVIKLPSNTNVPTPTIVDGKIYVSGGFGSKQYFAFDAKSGEKLWAVNLDDDGPSSSVEDDDVLVFNTESCTIFAVDAKTGRQLWSYWLGDPLMSMPTIANGKVFTSYPAAYTHASNNTNTHDFEVAPQGKLTHAMAAFDLKTGKILWQKWIDGDIMSAPVACGTDLYFTTFPGTLFKVEQEDGDFLAAKAIRATSAPVISNGQVLVSLRSDNGKECTESIATLDVNTLAISKQYITKNASYLDKKVQSISTLKSESSTMDAGNGFGNGAPANSGWMGAYDNIGQSNVSSLQAFQGSRILVINDKTYNTMGDELICSDPVKGKKVWTTLVEGDLHKVGGFLATPPIKAGEYMIVATYGGEVLVYNPETGRVAEKYSTNGDPIRYQPVAQDGWIYVTTTTGKLYAFQSNNPNITGWPMWGANAGHTNTVN